jgi:N utilization substance protein B
VSSDWIEVPRSQSRERALELLYEADRKERSVDLVVADQAAPIDDYTQVLLDAVKKFTAHSEDLIDKNSTSWPIDRLAILDRLILVLALSELQMDEHPPKAVVMNEAVELASGYSTDDSGRFVNGLLATVARQIRAE